MLSTAAVEGAPGGAPLLAAGAAVPDFGAGATVVTTALGTAPEGGAVAVAAAAVALDAKGTGAAMGAGAVTAVRDTPAVAGTVAAGGMAGGRETAPGCFGGTFEVEDRACDVAEPSGRTARDKDGRGFPVASAPAGRGGVEGRAVFESFGGPFFVAGPMTMGAEPVSGPPRFSSSFRAGAAAGGGATRGGAVVGSGGALGMRGASAGGGTAARRCTTEG